MLEAIIAGLGGLVIGQEVARQLGIRFIFVEKEDGKLVLYDWMGTGRGEELRVVAALADGQHRAEGGILAEPDQHLVAERFRVRHVLDDEEPIRSIVVDLRQGEIGLHQCRPISPISR